VLTAALKKAEQVGGSVALKVAGKLLMDSDGEPDIIERSRLRGIAAKPLAKAGELRRARLAVVTCLPAEKLAVYAEALDQYAVTARK
jgi:hypothetical protein